MVGPIQECIGQTKQLIELAERAEESNRDEVIEKIERLLEERGHSLHSIKGPFSDEEMALGKTLSALDGQLTAALKSVQKQIQIDINGLEQKRVSANRYSNPYSATQQLDGVFYDKRK